MATLQSVALKISHSTSEKLSKQQIAFNKLTAQIAAFEKKLIETKNKLESLFAFYSANMLPVQKNVAAEQVKLAQAISDASFKDKFSKTQKEFFKDVILDLLNKAFVAVEPDEAAEKLYDLWADESYKDECKSMDFEAHNLMNDMLKNKFGIDIDFSQFDYTPEGQARMMAHVQELMEETQKHKKIDDSSSSGKGKSKKQTAKEKQQREQEALQLKSLRSIYISLAKALHPDTETDEATKAIKEELMKKVTVAYDNRDLATLLKLEIEWLHQGDAQLSKLSEEKLKLYVNILKEKLDELRNEEDMLFSQPQYSSISNLAHNSEKQAINAMKSHIVEITRIGNDFNVWARDFSNSKNRKDLLEFTTAYHDSMVFQQMFRKNEMPF